MPFLRKITAKNKVSLPTLLTGLVTLSVLLTLTLLLIASYHSKKQSLIDTTLALNYTSASNMSQTVDSLFKSMRASLQYSAGIYSNLQSMSKEEAYSGLELMRNSSNYFNSVALVDEKGKIRNVSPASIGSVGKSITTKAAKEALASRKPYTSQPYITTNTKRLIVFMSEPLFDKDGEYKGYIGGTIYLQENNILNMIFGNNLKDDKGSYFYLVSSDGHLLFYPNKDRIGKDISANPIVRKLVEGQSGQERHVNLLGEELLAGYTKVPQNGWGVIVVTPMTVVNEQLNRHIKSLLLFTLAPLALLMLFVIWLARRLAKPFVCLANLVSKVGREKVELPEIKQHWNREADLLTKAIIEALTAIQKQTDQLTGEAMTDPLTGLTNRRMFELISSKWIEDQTPFSMLLIDVDRFKLVNDTYGHLVGDDVLKELARTIALFVRPDDVCCRYGGEEFVVLLRETAAREAFLAAERIRMFMENSDNPTSKPLTVSIGIAEFPIQAESSDELFQLADKALYRAKETGRNRTIIA
ncbi:cell signaling regulator [Paenibacillus baekrokdamisoli]|uniref:Cell signaling regulator n=1 Tax=Paenibacillus baekrokdamisoli TaxID=1712516 RepID=A0A3G9IU16_9BACL|nr:sensor domain-containing diguanylate cyclase [Paenibacillus baekrokdamisoli]MBB3072581.1 diguanylate cyclase (GGDEF)-like protein [Paenibacillus baekrokdamisoli]BBH22367.1 cell signaling regulator [Paenibacillus baekrokdamisoli]